MIFVSLYILAFLLFFLTHGNVFLRFCIVYCSQGNREQPGRYLKQYKNAGKRFRVYGAQNKRDICTIYNMSGRLVSDIETRAEGEKLISNEKFM